MIAQMLLDFEADVDADFVKAVVAEIKAEVSANAEGGLVVNFQLGF